MAHTCNPWNLEAGGLQIQPRLGSLARLCQKRSGDVAQYEDPELNPQ